METTAAVLHSAPGRWELETLRADTPRQNELVVKMAVAGVCHSDDHLVQGDIPVNYPMCGGHEGAGVVVDVGPNTPGFDVGDHVVLAWIPSCGRCRWCATGRQNLCDLGAQALAGARADDPDSYRMTLRGRPVGQMVGVGTFSQYTTVATHSAIRIPNEIPFDVACLVGCSVGTGWGSAVNSGQVRPGDVAIVMGVGGVGIHAVQGAALAGAAHVVAVDPVALKRDTAAKLGATYTTDSIDDAAAYARSVTYGQGADVAIVTVGVVRPAHVAQAFTAIRKGGVVVATGLGNVAEIGVPIALSELTLYEKRLVGSLYGSCAPSTDILRLLELYDIGKIQLDEVITKRYRLEDINAAYEDLHAGELIRGVIEFS